MPVSLTPQGETLLKTATQVVEQMGQVRHRIRTDAPAGEDHRATDQGDGTEADEGEEQKGPEPEAPLLDHEPYPSPSSNARTCAARSRVENGLVT